MFLNTDQTYQLGKNALDVASLRQQTISHNIANVNTKDYKSKQVEFEETLKKAMKQTSSSMRTTHDRHIGGTNSITSIRGEVYETASNTSMNLDGNNVDIDLEMANMAANQIQYSALIQNTNAKLQGYSKVIKG